MSIFLDRYINKYKYLWESLSVNNRKQEFIKMIDEAEIICIKYIKNNMIELLANHDYLLEEEMRNDYLITEYKNENTDSSPIFERNYMIHEYSTDINWITLSTNCCCNYNHTNSSIIKYERIDGTRHFFINLTLLPLLKDATIIKHINVHFKQESDLYIQSLLSKNVLNMFDIYKNQCVYQPIDAPTRININLFEYQKKTIGWMKNIENQIEINNMLTTFINKNHIIKIPNYPIYFDTRYRQIILSPSIEEFYIKCRGGILGCELGTGKTLTSIGLIMDNPCKVETFYKKTNYTPATLIAMPSHLIEQWVKEIELYCTPSPRIITLTTIKDCIINIDEFKSADIVLISYQLLINKRFDKKLVTQFIWYRIMIDEGHELLNDIYPSSIFEFLCKINSQYRWYISGTPFLNNNIKILQHIANFLHITSSSTIFTKKILHGSYDRIVPDPDKINLFLNNLYIRNTRELIDSEFTIPLLNKEYKMIEMTPIEQNHYNHIKTNNSRQRERMRQICCHMQLSDIDLNIFGNSSKSLDELKELMITSRQNDIIVLENKLLHDITESTKTKYINKIANIKKSLEYLVEIIKNINSENICNICFEEFTSKSIIKQCGHIICTNCITNVIQINSKCPFCRIPCTKSDIFTLESNNTLSRYENLQKKYGTKIANIINYIENIDTIKCNGSIYKRKKIIHKFKFEQQSKVMALSLENTASGINLTEAKHILFVNIGDSKSNIKTMEDQAISRSYRIGQKDSINVIYFITKNTIEEEIMNNNQFK
jgi:SNF2 family DNA or RNA helicase